MMSYEPKRRRQQKYKTVITDSLLRVDIYSFRSREIRLRGGTTPRRLVASCQPPAPHPTEHFLNRLGQRSLHGGPAREF